MFHDDDTVAIGTPNGGLQRLIPNIDGSLITARTRFMAGRMITEQAIAMVAHDKEFSRACQADKRNAKQEAERMVQRWRAELVRRMASNQASTVMDSARSASDRVANWSPAKQDYARRVTEGRGVS